MWSEILADIEDKLNMREEELNNLYGCYICRSNDMKDLTFKLLEEIEDIKEMKRLEDEQYFKIIRFTGYPNLRDNIVKLRDIILKYKKQLDMIQIAGGKHSEYLIKYILKEV